MMKRLFILLFCVFSLSARGQENSQVANVFMFVGDSIYRIAPVVTQTEYKSGWKFLDIQTDGSMTRYLWGKHSRQMADDRQPRLIIDTKRYKINDFIVIKLKEKKQYRKFISHSIFECEGRIIDLDYMAISSLGGSKYEIKPHVPMEPGEYVIANLKLEPTNEYGDIHVFPFTIVR